MPSGEGNPNSMGAIRVRAHQLAAGGGQDTAEAELLAAIADGTLPFEEIADDSLARCIAVFGPDSVIEALLSATGDSRAANRQAHPGEAVEKPGDARPTPAPGFQVSQKRIFPGAWRNTRRSWLAAAAAVIIVGSVIFLATRTTKTGRPQPTLAENDFSLQWPTQSPFDPSAFQQWGPANVPLPKVLPGFQQGPSTLGATGVNRFAPWQLATVIVRSEKGWGSGAFVSRDGWLLTNYHVVAGVAQEAALTAQSAKLEVITARIVDGRAQPQPALTATLYRVDPAHDLALLKLDSLPLRRSAVAFFPLAAKVRDGEDCFFLGPQKNGPVWSIRGGNVSRQFNYPEDLGHSAGSAATTNPATVRDRVRILVNDVPLSPGDSGGPLLNAKGELIGLGFATPANTRARTAGWYTALPQLRAFMQQLPAEPEGVPLDPWTAGLPGATVLEPELTDSDHDGRIDSLLYRYASPAAGGPHRGSPQPLAITVFADLAQRLTSTEGAANRVPYGLWGMEDRGGFRFDIFVTLRADHLVAVGYTNQNGVIDEIRIGTSGEGANVLWNRGGDGNWHASRPPSVATPLIDSKRFGGNTLVRLQAILRHALGDAGGHVSSGREQ